MKTPTNGSPHEVFSALARRGPYPTDAFGTTKVLWLALASRAFFENSDSNLMTAPWGAAGLTGADSIVYSTEWLDQAYFRPRSIRFLFSNILWKKELVERHLDPRTHPSPFTNGQIVAEFKVSASTNIADEVLPTEFELDRFNVGRAGNVELLEKYVGRVDSVTEGIQKITFPTLPYDVSVFDFRFAAEPFRYLNVRYWITTDGSWLATNDLKAIAAGMIIANRSWPPTNDARLITLVTNAKTNYPAFLALLHQEPRVPNRSLKSITYTCFIILLLAPLSVLFFRSRIKVKQKPS